MKANKIILTVTVEALSTDSLIALLFQVQDQLGAENVEGCLVSDDGDTVKWAIERIPVEF